MNRNLIEILLTWAMVAFAVAIFVGIAGFLMGASSTIVWPVIQEIEVFLFMGFAVHMAILLLKKLTKEDPIMRKQLLVFDNKWANSYPLIIAGLIMGLIGMIFGVYYVSTISIIVGAILIAYNCTRIIYKMNDKARETYDSDANNLMDRLKSEPVNLDARGLFKFIRDNNQCPDCRATPLRLLEGPSGGLSTNVKCADCNVWFNIIPEMEMLERIHR